MAENKFEELAEKDIASVVVSSLIGAFVGGCAAAVVENTLEAVMPEPVNLAAKVVTGVGTYAVGSVIGMQIANAMESDMMTLCGSLLTIKAAVNEMSTTEVNN